MTYLSELLEDMYTPEPNSGCWLWLGDLIGHGYGRVFVHRKAIYAHRLSWMVHRGAIASGLRVLHKCDVPSCINPDHLFLGTQQQNLQDCRDKGRAAYGTRQSGARLDDDKVRQIRVLLKADTPQQKIADQFGVSQSKISHIARGISWVHVVDG